MNYLNINENKDVRNRYNELVVMHKDLDRYFKDAINRILNFKNELEQTENKCENLVLEYNRLVDFYNELKEKYKKEQKMREQREC